MILKVLRVAYLNFRSRYGLLLLIFVVSGLSGLIYQSIWSHYLGIFLGHAAYAQSLVLALFMGGMAIGAALVARFGAGWRNLIRTYALVEAVIGLFALVFHWIFVSALGFSYDVIMPSLGAPWLVNAWKWLVAAGLILPQTILLGMTFPLMSGGIIRRWPAHDGQSLGRLYFTNSLGAALGVLCSTFYLLPEFGMPGAMVTAGILNLAVAGIAIWLSQNDESSRSGQVARSKSLSSEGKRLLQIVLLATFLSSAASFAYEIIFVRMLSLAVGSTLHAFELMLAAFIAGIALGALWIRNRADSTSSPLRLVGVLQILMGLTALLALALYSGAFAWVGFLMESLSRTDSGYQLFNLGTAIISILIMLPTAFFAGTTLPLFTVSLLRNDQGEASIGRVYALNTVGAILGVFAAMHLLIPVLGLKLALICAALVDILIGLFLLRWLAQEKRDYIGLGIATVVMIASMCVAVFVIHFDLSKLSSGVYRTGSVQLNEDMEHLFYSDGKTSSVSVFGSPNGYITIATNGKPDASMQTDDELPVSGDEPTMIVAGSIPFVYTDQPDLAAVIGFGSGMTTHTLLARSSLERVDTIEIEAEMVEGAKWFGRRVRRAYEDERSRIIIDDAKSFFAGNREQYDIIVSEPSNPWISGVGALFAKEFYEFVPRFLADDGVFVQWLQLYEINQDLVGSVLNAVVPEFTDIHAYLSSSSDLLLVASLDALPNSPDYGSLVLGDLASDLQHVGIDEASELALLRVADKRLLEALARLYKHPANSYYKPILSLEAPRTRFKKVTAGNLMRLPHLKVPLLEWLGVRRPPGLKFSAPEAGSFPGGASFSRSRSLVAALVEGQSAAIGDFSPDFRNWVISFEAAGEICRKQSENVSGAWIIDRLALLTELTLPFIDSEGLNGLLIDPVWLDCEDWPAGVDRALALVEANARRDADEMARLGREWLEGMDDHPDYLSPIDKLAFASLQFGLIGQGQYEAALAVEGEFGSEVQRQGDYGFARDLVEEWLQGQR